MRRIRLLVICSLVLAGTAGIMLASAEEDMSSAQLVQFAVSRIGSSSQEAHVSDFNFADSRQIGYSWDGNVTQTIYYDNIGNGSIIQWGESGDMPLTERSMFLDRVGESGFTWNWNNSDVNQTISIKNSENIYLKQIMGGLKRILFPDPKVEQGTGNWWFCGAAVNGTGGLPLCAEKMAKKMLSGKGTDRDAYMLQVLEEDNVFPPENFTPHVILTKWNITSDNGSLKVKFRAVNFGKKTYNATLKMYLTEKMNINLDGNGEDQIKIKGNRIELSAEDDLNGEVKINKMNGDIRIPEKKTVELGNYTIHSTKMAEQEMEVPLTGLNVKSVQLQLVSQ